MIDLKRWSVTWMGPGGLWRAFEPTPEDVAAAAPQLSAWYNEAHNRAMMTNDEDMDPADVVRHYAEVADDGGRNFLLHVDGRLVGDADLRHVDLPSRTAEFAIMIGERATQGKGIGTRFAAMLHSLAFQTFGFARVYVSIIPANTGSLRLFEKLGYRPDHSPTAQRFVEEENDIVMSLGGDEFSRIHGNEASAFAISCQ